MPKVKEIEISFSATVPTQPYGNVVVNQRWVAELDADESPEAASADLYQRIKAQVSAAIAPIAEAKRRQIIEQLKYMPAEERDKFTAALGAEQWLRSVNPELAFAGEKARDTVDKMLHTASFVKPPEGSADYADGYRAALEDILRKL